MHKVYKYLLPCHGEFELCLPANVRVLSVQVQAGTPYLWAMVDTTQPVVSKRFEVIGTGHSIHDPDGLVYVGTFQVGDGDYIFHVFERV